MHAAPNPHPSFPHRRADPRPWSDGSGEKGSVSFPVITASIKPGAIQGRVERGRPRPRPPGADAVETAQRDAHAPAERPRAPGARGDELHDLQPLGKTDLTRHAPGSPETYHNIWHCQKP